MFAAQRMCNLLSIDRAARAELMWRWWAWHAVRSLGARLKQTNVQAQLQAEAGIEEIRGRIQEQQAQIVLLTRPPELDATASPKQGEQAQAASQERAELQATVQALSEELARAHLVAEPALVRAPLLLGETMSEAAPALLPELSETLEDHIHRLEQQAGLWEQQCVQLKWRTQELEGRANTQELGKHELEGSYHELHGRNQQLETRNQELTAETALLESRIEELEGRNGTVVGGTQELEHRNLQLENINQHLDGRNQELEGQNLELGSRNQELDELERRIQELEGRIHESESRTHGLEIRNNELQSRNHVLESRDHESESRNHELEARNHELVHEVKEIVSAGAAALASHEAALERQNELEAQVGSLQAEVARLSSPHKESSHAVLVAQSKELVALLLASQEAHSGLVELSSGIGSLVHEQIVRDVHDGDKADSVLQLSESTVIVGINPKMQN
eukprot:TRINITY_DN12459_c0_g1_i2.p1 TRINITY_DN12459_c0_g1~~TRINITY_DN12459_c0_g1_i2.p1  ORF type:complete len:453 (+),score=146.76 TRINITY_DN12459_c0_g1_i2:368-1726(+)